MSDVKETRVSIIGAGALGGAVARGLHRAGCRVLAADAHPERLTRVREEGVELTTDNVRAAKEGEVVMFALKPHLTLGAVRELAACLKGKLCVSLAAVVTLDMLRHAVPEARWVRAMTNICAALNCAFTGITTPAPTDADGVWIRDAFGLLGPVEETDEGSLNALTALTGAAPAFFMSLMEAAAMGGIQSGLPKDLAYRGAMSALLGAARLSMEAGRHPSELRDDVCTPGGMTIEGIYEIERAGARAAMMKAVVLTAEKGKVLTDRIAASLKDR
ncbi:MAG: NAD(P)-binding domain-containing protein [Synergistaceae bacterium]|jgi:pyrroline-5-carboxylate reductase|nr:NAD(P)-binding domain-containing protein [Synergistaceae bacterium]